MRRVERFIRHTSAPLSRLFAVLTLTASLLVFDVSVGPIVLMYTGQPTVADVVWMCIAKGVAMQMALAFVALLVPETCRPIQRA